MQGLLVRRLLVFAAHHRHLGDRQLHRRAASGMDDDIAAFGGHQAADRALIGHHHVNRLVALDLANGRPGDLNLARVIGFQRDVLAVGNFHYARQMIAIFHYHRVRRGDKPHRQDGRKHHQTSF